MMQLCQEQQEIWIEGRGEIAIDEKSSE